MCSLEKLCLNLILQEFQRFHYSFSVSTNQTLKENFQFLQKKYSFKLASELSEKRIMKDEHLNFLLNDQDHSTYLDERWFKNSGKSIEDVICRLPNLEKAYLVYSCTDAILEKIAEFCPKIVEINASRSAVTDTGLKYLCKNKNGKIACPELKNLFIYSCNVTSEGVKYLIQNLSSLESVDYEQLPQILYSIHMKDLPNFVNVRSYNLVTLNLMKASSTSFYSDLLKICLTVCPKLKSLVCCITDEKQIDFFNNPRLEELVLCVEKPETKVNINNFLQNNGSNLVSLKVYQCIMSINILIASCPKLKDLELNRIDFLDDPNDSQCIFRYLTECTFNYTKNHNSCNKAVSLLLSSSPNLERLRINYGKLSPETKARILKCCENNLLREIKFFSSVVEMKFAKDILLSCPTLKTLILEDCDYLFNKKREIKEFAKKLKNKPEIWIENSMDFYD